MSLWHLPMMFRKFWNSGAQRYNFCQWTHLQLLLKTENLALEIFSESFSSTSQKRHAWLTFHNVIFLIGLIKLLSVLETIGPFYVAHNAKKVVHLSNFMENIINKKSLQPARTFRDLLTLTMFWKFSNCSRLRLMQFWEFSRHHLYPS